MSAGLCSSLSFAPAAPEHLIAAPVDGVVSRLNVRLGEQVDEGVELLVIEPAPQKRE